MRPPELASWAAVVSSAGWAGRTSSPGATLCRMTARASAAGSSRSAARLSSGCLATTPNARPRLSCGSTSTASTLPRRARAAARFAAAVVLPTPPLEEQTARRMPEVWGRGRQNEGGGPLRRGGEPHPTHCAQRHHPRSATNRRRDTWCPRTIPARTGAMPRGAAGGRPRAVVPDLPAGASLGGHRSHGRGWRCAR